MQVTIIGSGKLKASSPLSDLIASYLKQMKWAVHISEIPIKSHEKDYEKAYTALIPTNAILIALDERGDSLTSPQFSFLIEKYQLVGSPHLCFVIGGADGLPSSIKKLARETLSFGKATWPHMVVRLLLIEQLYRAHQILAGHPYHRE